MFSWVSEMNMFHLSSCIPLVLPHASVYDSSSLVFCLCCCCCMSYKCVNLYLTSCIPLLGTKKVRLSEFYSVRRKIYTTTIPQYLMKSLFSIGLLYQTCINNFLASHILHYTLLLGNTLYYIYL